MTTSASAIRRYSPWSGSLSGSTGTGLDQLISWLGRDPGLRGSTDAPSLAAGIAAAGWIAAWRASPTPPTASP